MGRIADDIAECGLSIIKSALPTRTLMSLSDQLHQLDHRDFRPAAIGRNAQRQQDSETRSDRIAWVDERHKGCQSYLAWMEQLRLTLNQQLFLGLFSYECHFAVYAPESRYRKHLDAFQGSRSRILSTILYLNPDWQSGDGGELALYPSITDDADEQQDPVMVVPPRYGTLITFLSEQYPHEVLPANKNRYSMTGWFRVQATPV